MRTKFILLCAATAALAACAKTEVTPEVLNQDAEISFLTAPVTKGETIAFSEDNVFQSSAFYHSGNFSYGTTADEYISKATVSCTDKTNHVWKANATYYWPKDGNYLTFFSWSLNTNSLTFADGNPTVDITAANGVSITGYSSLKNDDFMVAKIAADQTQNTTPGSYKTVSNVSAGVPTLFNHKTSQVVIKVKTKADYSGTPCFQKFTLNSVEFVDLSTSGNYNQKDEAWTNFGPVKAATPVANKYYSNTTGQVITTTETEVEHKINGTTDGVYLYVPQGFTNNDGKKIKVTYTVTKIGGTVTNTTGTTYTAEIDMFKVMGGDTANSTAANPFAIGKKHVITLIFGLDEILWDPAVEDWDAGYNGEGEVKDVAL